MSQEETNSEVVVARGKSSWSDLWKKEDYWAIWLGFFILAVAAIFVTGGKQAMVDKRAEYSQIMKAETGKAPFKTIEWYEASEARGKVAGMNLPAIKAITNNIKTPSKWSSNPLDSLMRTQAVCTFSCS